MGYGGVTPKKMMQHIHDKTCIKMATLDKANLKKWAQYTVEYHLRHKHILEVFR